MRFKKGSKVEVLGKEEGVWRLGEIISGNGHTYGVRYDVSMFASGEDAEERVPSKAIRPYPPFVDYLDTWSIGDVVEIYVNQSWMTAVVMEVMDGNYYLVQSTGTARELQVNKVNIRVPQLWQDGQWVVIGKGNGSCEDVNSTNASTLSCYQKASPMMQQAGASRKFQEGNSYLYTENNNGFQESCVVSARTLKRASPFWSSDFEAYDGSLRKRRAIGKKGTLQGVVKGYQTSSLKKDNSWTHACFASKDQKMMLGHKRWGQHVLPFLLPWMRIFFSFGSACLLLLSDTVCFRFAGNTKRTCGCHEFLMWEGHASLNIQFSTELLCLFLCISASLLN